MLRTPYKILIGLVCFSLTAIGRPDPDYTIRDNSPEYSQIKNIREQVNAELSKVVQEALEKIEQERKRDPLAPLAFSGFNEKSLRQSYVSFYNVSFQIPKFDISNEEDPHLLEKKRLNLDITGSVGLRMLFKDSLLLHWMNHYLKAYNQDNNLRYGELMKRMKQIVDTVEFENPLQFFRACDRALSKNLKKDIEYCDLSQNPIVALEKGVASCHSGSVLQAMFAMMKLNTKEFEKYRYVFIRRALPNGEGHLQLGYIDAKDNLIGLEATLIDSPEYNFGPVNKLHTKKQPLRIVDVIEAAMYEIAHPYLPPLKQELLRNQLIWVSPSRWGIPVALTEAKYADWRTIHQAKARKGKGPWKTTPPSNGLALGYGEANGNIVKRNKYIAMGAGNGDKTLTPEEHIAQLDKAYEDLVVRLETAKEKGRLKSTISYFGSFYGQRRIGAVSNVLYFAEKAKGTPLENEFEAILSSAERSMILGPRKHFLSGRKLALDWPSIYKHFNKRPINRKYWLRMCDIYPKEARSMVLAELRSKNVDAEFAYNAVSFIEKAYGRDPEVIAAFKKATKNIKIR